MTHPSLFDMFAREMNYVLGNSLVTYNDQEELLKKLFKAEREFKAELLRTKRGRDVYVQFMNYILNERNNILAARIYFRERQNTFSRRIAKTFYREKPHGLARFRINYWFAYWTVQHSRPNKKLLSTFDEIKDLRRQLCETNMPLAINRAKIFWSKVPESKLEYMDLIQACSEGLMNAIDKFVPPYREVFRSTAIGRMLSNMIDDYNSTIIKFSPKERRIIYRAKNAKNKQKIESPDVVVRYVNESFKGVTNSHLEKLISAATTPVSLNETTNETLEIINTFASSDDIERDAIKRELDAKLESALSGLNTLERKAILLQYGMMFLERE